MNRILTGLVIMMMPLLANGDYETDTFQTAMGELEITFIGHGTLMMTVAGKVIHIDPTLRASDYNNLPAADLIIVTHHHGDHLDSKAIEKLTKDNTRVVLTQLAEDNLKRGTILNNGEEITIGGIRIEARPAYNLVHMRSANNPFHPKGDGNSYILTIGGKRIFIGGDTENTPEMKAMRGIDIAFLPMNLPYTMTPEMVADAAKAFRPKILYPYHYGRTDTDALLKLMEGEIGIEVRMRKMP